MIEQLLYNENNTIVDKNNKEVIVPLLLSVGLKQFVIPHPGIDISDYIKKIEIIDPELIPEKSNSYIALKFNPDTVHFKEDGKMYAVYAVQFYHKIDWND